MTTSARRVASVPRRMPAETWRRICDLVCQADDPARAELDSVLGVAALLISEEYTADQPIVFGGAGPQVRFYTVHNDEALEADLDDELPLAVAVTDGDWRVSLPARAPDLEWAERELAARSSRITVRDAGA